MDRIVFRVNGKPRSVGSDVRSDLSLLEYLRVRCELRGTKYLCRQGGCGACIVTAARPGQAPVGVNSCLVAVTSCQDWEITTIEDVGNRIKGYHPLQTTLAHYNGSQCGYCSPGWVMAMYSLLQSRRNLTKLEIEASFGSNICRCTGYRPILEAFKRFASDASETLPLQDIEDLDTCQKTGKSCRKNSCDSDWCVVDAEDLMAAMKLDNEGAKIIDIKLKDGKLWSRVQTVSDIFEVLRRKGDDDYMLVNGNTAKGAYPIAEYPRVLIDISGVQELRGYRLDQNLILGAGSTLTETIDIFQHLAETREEFHYLERLREHLLLVAHIPVRNLGSIAGNLMIKYQHRDFQSDVFILLEAVGAYLTIVDAMGAEMRVTPVQFLNIHMQGRVIMNVLLPPLGLRYKFISFKILPRSQNVHAIVHSAFLIKLSPETMVTETRIVYGGLSPNFVHARNTEKFLLGRKLFTNETLQGAIQVLEHELVVVPNPPEPSVEYRKNLAVNLFYKGLLQLCPKNIVSPRIASGAVTLRCTRPVSRARQIVPTDPARYPLNQPIPKVEALIQCAGEAPYTEDLPQQPREVFGAFLLADTFGDIVSIDSSEALKYPGVLAFYSAKDIPGLNSFTPNDLFDYNRFEEIFCSGRVKYTGQVIGVVVAEARAIADYAVRLVKVNYMNVRKPVVDIRITKTDPKRTTLSREFTATNTGTDVAKVITGKETIYQQIHFSIETLVSVATPTEEGVEVRCATQHLYIVQMMISRALKIPENKIDVYVRRLGGAYGVKCSRTTQVAVVSALVAVKLNRPCRILLPLETIAKGVGKRLPCSADFEVAVDKCGKIQYCNEDIYQDHGYLVNESAATLLTYDSYYNCYDQSRWNYRVFSSTTDTASNTLARGPGTLEAVAQVEFIMERISYEMSLDPFEVRLRNLDKKLSNLKEMAERLKTDAQYISRRKAVCNYNMQNRWKKRGLRFAFMRFVPSIPIPYFDVNLSCFQDDGTIAIVHSGIEMGQGINTKAVQIAAHFLGIPIEKIQVKANTSMVAPNATLTAGSVTSMNIGIGVQQCCEELLLRLAPIRAKNPGATWEELVKAAYLANVDLQTHGFVADSPFPLVFGVTMTEVEIDVLTGEWEILRVHLLEDAGLSVNPSVDIGQVEGAFIMGLGYWTTEQVVYDNTGEVLTDRTWNYYVPLAQDIPQDFRVYFKENSFSDKRVLGAKAVGEPSICMSVSIAFALREAITAARSDAGIPSNVWFQIDGPYTREAIQLSTASKYAEYKFY